MDSNQIRQMAEEAGMFIDTEEFVGTTAVIGDIKRLEAFAKSIRNTVLEEAALICDCEWNGDSDTYESSQAYNECAEEIRSMKS